MYHQTQLKIYSILLPITQKLDPSKLIQNVVDILFSVPNFVSIIHLSKTNTSYILKYWFKLTVCTVLVFKRVCPQYLFGKEDILEVTFPTVIKFIIFIMVIHYKGGVKLFVMLLKIAALNNDVMSPNEKTTFRLKIYSPLNSSHKPLPNID